MSLLVKKPENLLRPMKVPSKLLMGPGPSNVSERVLKAMTNPMLGHLHPEFLNIMDEVKEGLQYLFQTRSGNVFCASGTGHAGLESVMVNLLEAGDVILIAKNGIWGDRGADIANRQDADVRMLNKQPGEAFTLEEINEALMQHKPKVFFIVHAETSTGVVQPLDGIGKLCKRYGTLLVVDTVASLGGIPFLMDEWEVDVTYSGSQKVLSCPPSLAPIALSDKAMNCVRSRRTAPRSFYFDYIHLANYWGCDAEPRRYHHTGPISSVYALREGLAQVAEEGLQNVWERHSRCAHLLQEGLEKLGLCLYVKEREWRSPTVTTVVVPQGVQWKSVTDHLMQRYKIEMSGGLGPTFGKVWRIGLLGENCSVGNIELLLRILSECLESKYTLNNKL